jgi:hypothetical protein
MNMKKYKKPLILKVQTQLSNKFGASPSYARKTWPMNWMFPLKSGCESIWIPVFIPSGRGSV